MHPRWAEIKAGKLTKMNKAGKAAVATQIIAAAAEAKTRFVQKEEKGLAMLDGKMKNWLVQLQKMRQEEAKQDACCTIL